MMKSYDTIVLAQPGAWARPGAPAIVVARILAGSLLIALGAQLEIRLPFTPVPITGQTLAVALVGMALGARNGAAAAVAYLCQGAAGLPVFAGGASGIHHFAGPTAGYLLGFVVSAASAGFLCERGWDRNPLRAAAALLLSSLWVFLIGSIVLAFHVGGIVPAVQAGVLPFVPGDLVKCAIAASALPLVRPRLRHANR